MKTFKEYLAESVLEEKFNSGAWKGFKGDTLYYYPTKKPPVSGTYTINLRTSFVNKNGNKRIYKQPVGYNLEAKYDVKSGKFILDPKKHYYKTEKGNEPASDSDVESWISPSSKRLDADGNFLS